jgi:hypothetical protein
MNVKIVTVAVQIPFLGIFFEFSVLVLCSAPQAEDKTFMNSVYSSRGRANSYMNTSGVPGLVPLFWCDKKTEK